MRGLSKQIFMIMHLVDIKMIEIKEFRIMKVQNIQRRLQAIRAQVK